MKTLLLKIGNSISGVVMKAPENTRTIFMYACLIILNASCYVYLLDDYTNKFITPAMVNAGLGTLVFAILIVVGMDRKYTEEVFNKQWVLSLFLCICGITIIISGFLHDIGYSYIAMGMFMAFMMPLFCLVWGDKEHLTNLFKALSITIVVLFIAFFLLQVFITPRYADEFFLGGRYKGMCGNSNGIAKASLPAYYAAIYLIGIGKRKTRFLYAIVAGMSLAMIVMAATRACFLSICLLTFFYLWMRVKNSWKDTNKLKNLAIGVLIATAIIAISVPTSKACLEWKSKNMSQEQSVEIDDSLGLIDRADQGQNEDGTTNIDAVSSGRITIWKEVIQGAKFMGRDKDDIVFNAHNAIIEYLKRSGWIAAIAFFLVELGSAVWILVTVFSKKKVDDYQMFAVIGITAYGIVSLLDIVDLPFAKFITTVFYLCFAAMCVKRNSTIS